MSETYLLYYFKKQCGLDESHRLWPYIRIYEQMPRDDRRRIQRACAALRLYCPRIGMMGAFELVCTMGIFLASDGVEGVKNGRSFN
jgi:hypothetical protein